MDLPSSSMSFFKSIEESRWLYQVDLSLALILHSSTRFLVTKDTDDQCVHSFNSAKNHASSVMICVEDGWDTGAQLVSISELLLDPYYRTFRRVFRR